MLQQLFLNQTHARLRQLINYCDMLSLRLILSGCLLYSIAVSLFLYYTHDTLMKLVWSIYNIHIQKKKKKKIFKSVFGSCDPYLRAFATLLILTAFEIYTDNLHQRCTSMENMIHSFLSTLPIHSVIEFIVFETGTVVNYVSRCYQGCGYWYFISIHSPQ